METLSLDLRKALCKCNLPHGAFVFLLRALEHGGKGISGQRALKLVGLLSHLKTGGLNNLSSIQKRKGLENFIDLLRQGQEEWTGRICYVVYEGKHPPKEPAFPFPEGMIKALLELVKREQAENVREILWEILLRKGIRLELLVKPEDVISGLWENNTIVRNNVVQFLFTHYTPDDVVEAICRYTVISGKSVPGLTFKRYVGLIKGLEVFSQKKNTLKMTTNIAQLGTREIEEIWSDYLKGLNRFELVNIYTSNADSLGWVEALKKRESQLSFSFKPEHDISGSQGSFHARIRAIQQLKPDT